MKSKIKKFFKNPYNGAVSSFKVRGIQFIITISFTLISILAMLFVGIVIYNKFSISLEDNATLSTKQLVNQVNSNIEYYLKGTKEVSNLLEKNIYLNQKIPNSKLKDQMNIIQNIRGDIASLAVFSDKGELIIESSTSVLKDNVNVVNQDWFKSALNKSDNLRFSLPHVQNLFNGKHDWVVSLSRAIYFYKGNERVRGVLLVDMNYSTIGEICQNISIGKRGYIYIVDSDNNIIYHPEQQLINIGLKSENREDYLGSYLENSDEGKQLITIKTVDYTNWKVVAVAYMSEILDFKKTSTNFIGWILFVCIILIIFIFGFISAKISHPIKQLEESMKMVEAGDFNIYIDVKGEDEVERLSTAFNLMISKVRYLMAQIVIEQEAKRKSELNALQAQINPHFLYNTLDSIVWMAENEKNDGVITMVTALAKLFRISISRGKNIITVREEMEHAKNYLIIQKIRYKNKFVFEIINQKEVLEYKTLKLILQPLIENSIYHGIEYMVDEGFIKISVSVTNGKLLYEICDNGLGIEPEVLKHILEYREKDNTSSGVGVKNVHERIQLSYGSEFGLEMKSEIEEGTTIKIWLPLIKE
ncbi:sensor histidine kinase [Clostridium tagluense]|uniref:sensor histidine kinase n=1 Tax=Clostridium tagluense TaxID=360422 RepID=UPI001CF13E34|nr:sensor histidine kinase [Clostridium tagluense]MCB2313932.1 sensor histidine kinase [Clostridium tagluense]MCB2318749.1 sensor histidine kinase [Clostridium tagluense]MCB2323599.1 sensor histidine kinase [Clostridium tagluense]MCB2328491.1 sensor histidine kinase [Clostridium tagluense]MCB2333344.1 sensor histidine kinase [Clostridium tagluense]